MSFEGAHLKITGETWDPWVHIIPGKDPGGLVTATGILPDFVETLSKKLNFSYTIIRPSDGSWGVLLNNGSLTGMIGQVLNREVDFALGPFTIRPYLLNALEYTTTIYVEPFGIIVPWPELESNPMGFINTFSWQVWVGLLLMLLFSGLVGFFMMAVLKGHTFWKAGQKTKDKQRDEVFDPSWLKLFIEEGIKRTPQNVIGRIHFLTLCLVTFFVHSAYKGILTAHLVAPKVSIPIDGLEDLISYGKMPWGFPTTATFEDVMNENSSIPAYREAGRHYIRIYDCYEDREMMVHKKMAYFCDQTSMKMMSHAGFSKHAQCMYYITKEILYKTPMAFIFTKNSPYFETFNKYTIMLTETGIIDHLLKKEMINSTFCDKRPGSGMTIERPLTIGDLAGVFYFLLAGLGVSFLVFIAEIITHKYLRAQDTASLPDGL